MWEGVLDSHGAPDEEGDRDTPPSDFQTWHIAARECSVTMTASGRQVRVDEGGSGGPRPLTSPGGIGSFGDHASTCKHRRSHEAPTDNPPPPPPTGAYRPATGPSRVRRGENTWIAIDTVWGCWQLAPARGRWVTIQNSALGLQIQPNVLWMRLRFFEPNSTVLVNDPSVVTGYV